MLSQVQNLLFNLWSYFWLPLHIVRNHTLLHAALIAWRINAIDDVRTVAPYLHYFFCLWEVIYLLVLLLIGCCVGILHWNTWAETKVSLSQLCFSLKSLFNIVLIRYFVVKLQLCSRFGCELWIVTNLNVRLTTIMNYLGLGLVVNLPILLLVIDLKFLFILSYNILNEETYYFHHFQVWNETS